MVLTNEQRIAKLQAEYDKHKIQYEKAKLDRQPKIEMEHTRKLAYWNVTLKAAKQAESPSWIKYCENGIEYEHLRFASAIKGENVRMYNHKMSMKVIQMQIDRLNATPLEPPVPQSL